MDPPHQTIENSNPVAVETFKSWNNLSKIYMFKFSKVNSFLMKLRDHSFRRALVLLFCLSPFPIRKCIPGIPASVERDSLQYRSIVNQYTKFKTIIIGLSVTPSRYGRKNSFWYRISRSTDDDVCFLSTTRIWFSFWLIRFLKQNFIHDNNETPFWSRGTRYWFFGSNCSNNSGRKRNDKNSRRHVKVGTVQVGNLLSMRQTVLPETVQLQELFGWPDWSADKTVPGIERHLQSRSDRYPVDKIFQFARACSCESRSHCHDAHRKVHKHCLKTRTLEQTNTRHVRKRCKCTRSRLNFHGPSRSQQR